MEVAKELLSEFHELTNPLPLDDGKRPCHGAHTE